MIGIVIVRISSASCRARTVYALHGIVPGATLIRVLPVQSVMEPAPAGAFGFWILSSSDDCVLWRFWRDKYVNLSAHSIQLTPPKVTLSDLVFMNATGGGW
jgi:hypothetical protein